MLLREMTSLCFDRPVNIYWAKCKVLKSQRKWYSYLPAVQTYRRYVIGRRANSMLCTRSLISKSWSHLHHQYNSAVLHRTLLHSTHEVAQDHKSPCVLQGIFAGHGRLRHQDMFVPKSQITTEAEVKFISRLVDNSTCSVTRLHSRELSLEIYDSEDNSTCIPAKTKHQGSLF